MRKNRYHYIDTPLNPPTQPEGFSSLHLLYPGRYMRVDFSDRKKIPPCDPKEVEKLRHTSKRETKKYEKWLDDVTKKQGHKHEITYDAYPEVDLETNDPMTLNDVFPKSEPQKKKKGGKEKFEFPQKETSLASPEGSCNFFSPTAMILLIFLVIGIILLLVIIDSLSGKSPVFL
jgi:hypothetical protein